MTREFDCPLSEEPCTKTGCSKTICVQRQREDETFSRARAEKLRPKIISKTPPPWIGTAYSTRDEATKMAKQKSAETGKDYYVCERSDYKEYYDDQGRHCYQAYRIGFYVLAIAHPHSHSTSGPFWGG